jgi:hypothetical protein
MPKFVFRFVHYYLLVEIPQLALLIFESNADTKPTQYHMGGIQKMMQLNLFPTERL